jgi:hypothetical protein
MTDSITPLESVIENGKGMKRGEETSTNENV